MQFENICYFLGAVKGVATVVFAASTFSSSLADLSQSVKKLTKFIKSSAGASHSLTQSLDGINKGFEFVIATAPQFAQAISDATDEYGNLNVLDLDQVVDALNDVSKAHFVLSAAIQAKVNGDKAGSSTGVEDLARTIEEAADAEGQFAVVSDAVHGATGFVFGTAADLLSVVQNIANFSKSLYGLSAAVSNLSNPKFDKLVSALDYLAQTEAKISKSFDRLNYLS